MNLLTSMRYLAALNRMLTGMRLTVNTTIKAAVKRAMMEKNGVVLDAWDDTLRSAVAQMTLDPDALPAPRDDAADGWA